MYFVKHCITLIVDTTPLHCDQDLSCLPWLFFSAFMSLAIIFLSWPPGLGLLVFIAASVLLLCFPKIYILKENSKQKQTFPYRYVPTYWRACPGQSYNDHTRSNGPQTFFFVDILCQLKSKRVSPLKRCFQLSALNCAAVASLKSLLVCGNLEIVRAEMTTLRACWGSEKFIKRWSKYTPPVF